MITNFYRDWRAIIDRVYDGDLDRFNDVPTVQIMWRKMRRALDEDAAILDQLWGPNLREYRDVFADERQFANEELAFLEDWLIERCALPNPFHSN